MKRISLTLPEIFYNLSFLTYLFGCSLTLIEHGTEMSLWIMTLAILISAWTTTLPWIGIQWLRMNKKGSQVGWWIALLLQIASWGTFIYAMLARLDRNLSSFYLWIVITTLLWATWLLIFIFSRYAWSQPVIDDKLNNSKYSKESIKEEDKTT